MAAQQPYHAYVHHSKGMLMPGQTISVNKYTVQVERYLTQGGFAHVYLVRTQMPVYNTTHHVLKHIVVANEAMLTEVKKEVDVMRLLRGHPNIVYLIDAAWARMPNGAFEVYILMEYCPGGGMIDMMNRRLRERLTEAEILQIFVDVCEAVAHMHNSRPPLLHRDLKVENILQSSSTSFKLCDFGSASTVSKPATDSQQIRAVEADLNRHTTLQYRAPEMIDLHSRRPIDEKSDVWALGVLLYKLCYYTTPFEEHGPLAILNVQYRFPSYPVYSQDMVYLISSMLREQGAQRPTVFEILTHVHKLRGTKSPYKYPLPTITPLGLRSQGDRTPNPLDGVVTFQQHTQSQATDGQASAEARKVNLVPGVPQERRGRPKPSSREAIPLAVASSSGPSTPLKPLSRPPSSGISERPKVLEGDGFGTEGDVAWNAAIAKNASIITQGNVVNDDAWSLPPKSDIGKAAKASPAPNDAFNSDFVSQLSGLGGSNKPILPRSGATWKIKDGPHISVSKGKDAFEGLGLMTPISKPAPTLGEARKLRTGLAIINSHSRRSGNNDPILPSSSPRLQPKIRTARVSPVPPPKPETDVIWSSSKPSVNKENIPAESRFPSLEELDATFSLNPSSSSRNSDGQDRKAIHSTSEPPPLPSRPTKIGSFGTGNGISSVSSLLRPSPSGHRADGTRSEQITGIAMREIQRDRTIDGPVDDRKKRAGIQPHLSSISVKQHISGSPDLLLKEKRNVILSHNTSQHPVETSTPMPSIDHSSRSSKTPDWLTGDDDIPPQPFRVSRPANSQLKLRESPSKRASLIEQNDIPEATVPQQSHVPIALREESLLHITTESPTASRFVKAFPAINNSSTAKHSPTSLTVNWNPTPSDKGDVKAKEDELSSSSDEEPEEPTAIVPLPPKASGPLAQHRDRRNSVHNLVDLWGGGIYSAKEKQSEVPTPSKQNTVLAKPKSTLSAPRPVSPVRKSSPLVSSGQNPLPNPSRIEHSQSSTSVSGVPSPSPGSGRTRPQSMFIFPVKSVDTSSPPTPSPIPSEEPQVRRNRRTSISDMVQHFETIQASARVNATPPSPLNNLKSLPLAREAQEPERPLSRRASKPSLDKMGVALPGLNSPSMRSSGDYIKRRTSLTVPNSRVPTHLRQSPVEKLDTDSVEKQPSPRAHKPTIRSEDNKPSSVPGHRPIIGREEVVKQSQIDVPSASDNRDPSPETTYQGVGKLIDQWQRKSAEAEASRNVILSKRTSIPPKRAGLVPGAGKG